jgi:hypothetical protein
LRAAYRRGVLHRLTDPAAVNALLDELTRTDWVVYPKLCVIHTERVVEYLAPTVTASPSATCALPVSMTNMSLTITRITVKVSDTR